MTRTHTIIALAAAAALAGCNAEDHNIVGGEIEDPMADELANAAPVQLPPSIQASKTYRCKDNSLIYIDWLSDGSANLRSERNGPATHVAAAPAAEPGATPSSALVAEGGYSVTGNATAASVTVARPGKGSQSCKG